MTVDLTPFTATSPQGPSTDETTGERWYFYEPYGRMLSVTTAFRSIAKSGLVMWAGQLAAAAAFVELPTVITASRRKPCERTHSRCQSKHGYQATCEACPCGDCRECVQKWLADRHMAESSRRSDEGKRVHDVIEWWWKLDGEIRPHDPDVAPYVASFLAFVSEYGLTPASFLLAEAVVINPAEKYAGQTDGVVRFEAVASEAAAKLVARVLRARGEYSHIKTGKALVRAVIRDQRHVDLVIDWKTKEKTVEEGGAKFYPEYALQTAGYRMAPVVLVKETQQYETMPDTDGAVVVQLLLDGAKPRLVVADEVTFEAFLCALRLYVWLSELGTRAVGAYTFPLDLKPAPTPALEAPAEERLAEVIPLPTTGDDEIPF